jgi:hypothetical protein
MRSNKAELNDLALADRHISEAQARVDAQRLVIESLRHSNADTVQALDLLQTMEKTLEQFRAHRELIVETLGRS